MADLKAQLKTLIAAKEYRAAIVLLQSSNHPDKQLFIDRIKARMAEEAKAAHVPEKKKTGASFPTLYYGAIAGLVILLVVFLGIILVTGGQPAARVLPTVAVRATSGDTSAPSDSAVKWNVSESTSAFDDSKTVAITLLADNRINTWLDTEIPVLVLRCKERKLEAYVSINSQFAVELDENYDNSPTVRIRFDSDPAYSLRLSIYP